MSRNIVVGIPTLNRYDLLEHLLRALLSGESNPDRIVVIDNGGKVYDHIEPTVDFFKKVNVFSPSKNMGIAASWNFIMKNFCSDVALLMNDDVLPSKTMLSVMRSVIDKDEKNGMWTTCLSRSNMFSCFALSKALYDEIGEFDETFYPAYFEDNDYYYRLKRAKKKIVNIEDALCSHKGSATLKLYDEHQMEEHHKQFRKNQEYYMAKWGGIPSYERFSIPFAGGTYAPRS